MSSWYTSLWFCSALSHVYAGMQKKDGLVITIDHYLYTAGLLEDIDGEHSFTFSKIVKEENNTKV